MKNWTAKDILEVIIFNVVLIFLLPYGARLSILGTLSTLITYFIAAALISLWFTYRLKVQKKSVKIPLAILLVFLAICILLYLMQPDFFDYREALVFGMLFAFIHSAGLLTGSAAGYLIWYSSAKQH